MDLGTILDINFLDSISFESSLNTNLANFSMSKFDIISDFEKVKKDIKFISNKSTKVLFSKGLNYRFKSLSSTELKIQKYKANVRKAQLCFNDLIGVRIVVDSFETLVIPNYFKVLDLRYGKKQDDGYRAVHLYYIKSNRHYPIEIQIWESRDALFYNWQHTYCYKKESLETMRALRYRFDTGIIQTEVDFLRELNILHCCEYVKTDLLNINKE